MTVEQSIQRAKAIAHARGYFAGICEITKYVSANHRDDTVARYMRQYEIDHPIYARIKNDN